MWNFIKRRYFFVCGKTGKITGIKKGTGFWKYVFPLTGVAAIIWYIIRVLPKPVRATYPCMKVAAPLAGSFIGYVLSLSALGWAIQKFRSLISRQKYVIAVGCILVGVSALFFNLAFSAGDAWAAPVPNAPMGTPRGLFAKEGKSRVTWCRDGSAVTAPVNAANWWANQYNSQSKIDALMSASIKVVGNANDEATAWINLFKDFNSTHGRGNNGYTAGETIAVKINMNNTSPALGAKGGRTDNDQIDASPQLIVALVRSLKTAGVPENRITVGDPSRYIPPHLQQIVRGAGLSGLILESHDSGGDADVHTATFTAEGTLKYSTGMTTGTSTRISQSFANATYIIDMAILKGHSDCMTLCGKNFFGCTGIDTNWNNNLPAHYNLFQSQSAFVDYLSSKYLGGKTLLFMIDALYGSQEAVASVDDKWPMFGNQWPGMVLLSQDGVAIDSVATDFFDANFPGQGALSKGWDNYLHDAAVPTNKTYIGPDGTGRLTASLGVHEHWNNATARQYSGNMGANGIELVSVSPSSTPTPRPTATPTATGLKGDVNGDGMLTILDALAIARYSSGLDVANFNVNLADFNADGNVNILDALRVAQYATGLIPG